MDGADNKPEFDFLESAPEPAGSLADLETEFLKQCETLRRKNHELIQRNQELIRTAEVGWEAEAEIKKLRMTAATLADELECWREACAARDKKLKDMEQEKLRLRQRMEAQAQDVRKAEQQFQVQLKQKVADVSSGEARIRALQKEIEALRQEQGEQAQWAFAYAELEKICAQQKTELAKVQDDLLKRSLDFESLQAELQLEVENARAVNESQEQRHQESQTALAIAEERIEALRAQIESLTADFEKRLVEQRENQSCDYHQLKREASAQTAELERQIAELAKLAMEKDLEAQKWTAEAATRHEKIIELEGELQITRAEFMKQLSGLNQDAMQAENEIRMLNARLEKTTESVKQLEAEVAEEQERNKVLNDKLDWQKTGASEIKRKLSAQTTWIGDLESTVASQQGTIEALKARIEKLRASENEMRRRAEEESAFAEKTRRMLETEQVQLNALRSQLQSQTALREAAAAQVEQRLQEIALLKEASAKQLTLIAELSEVGQRQQRELTEAQAERDNLRRILDSTGARSESERQDLESLGVQLRQREAQLRQYANNISREKAEVIRCATQLAEEIHSARTLNPLKDYLSLTEFELSRIELQLKKTPTVSLDRPRLEACLSQMHEQREFLKSAIAKSKRQLDEQAASLLKIARGQKVGAIPPLPPNSRDFPPET